MNEPFIIDCYLMAQAWARRTHYAKARYENSFLARCEKFWADYARSS